MARLSIFLWITIISLWANASSYECRWSAEGTNDYFESNNLDLKTYALKPMVYVREICGVKPCIGYVYCRSTSNAPPIIKQARCKAIFGQCPTADKCVEDTDVLRSDGYPTYKEYIRLGGRALESKKPKAAH